LPQTAQGIVSRDVITGVGITSLIFAVSIYTPIFGFFCALFIPLPILFYRAKLGRKAGIAIPLATAIVMVLLLGRLAIDILFFVELMVLGLTLSELIEKNLSIEAVILTTCGIVMATGLTALLFYSGTKGTGLLALLTDYVARNLELTLALYKNMGVSEESIMVISNSLEHVRYVLVRIIPALVGASGLFVAWANLLLARALFRAKALVYPDFGVLNRWKAPEQLVWGVIAGGLLIFLPNRALKIIGLNGMIIFMMIYFFQGIAIVAFYFEKKRLPRMLRVFLYSLIMLQQFIVLLVIGLGFFDMWLNFRKLKTPEKDETI